MLTLTIKKKWFDMISSGEKPEEYRGITPYYNARLGSHIGSTLELMYRNGYSAESPKLKVKASVTIGTGSPKWGAIPNKEYYILHIHEKQYIPPETFRIKARRCKRCGGLLTSKQAVEDGYGHVCKQRAAEEAANAECEKCQICMFDSE